MLEGPPSATIEAAAQDTLHRLKQGARALAIVGPPTAGKSTALSRVVDLASGTWSVVHAAFPMHGDDGAAVAMATVAAQLDESLLSCVKDVRVSWSTKLNELRAKLVERGNDCLLLLDEPRLRPTDPTASIFVRRAEELSRTLLSVNELRYVVAMDVSMRPEQETVSIQPSSDVSRVLARDAWNGMGEYARTLLDTGADALSLYSPLQLRLAVALVASGVNAGMLVDRRWAPRELVRTLFERVDDGAQLKRTAGRLAVHRIPFGEEAVVLAGAGELSPVGKNVLESALLFGPPNERRLHELVATEARSRRWLSTEEDAAAHADAADQNRGEFARASERGDVVAAIRREIEVVHHLTEAGDVEAIDAGSVFFVEQYDALGKALSIRRRYASAVKAYERAIGYAPDDSYAHHYLGYNLDVPGREPIRVEASYRKAIDLSGCHSWYRGRHMCFLIARGRTEDARRQWTDALSVLIPSGASDDERLYRSLHGNLSRLLLHRGQLDFAQEVLDDVVPEMHRLPWYRALERLLVRLREAEANESVFPPGLSVEARWNGPHLLRSEQQRSKVEWWRPGRVAAVEGKAVHVRVASREGDDVSYGWMEFPDGEFAELSPLAKHGLLVPVGTFVEVVRFTKNSRLKRTMIFAHGSRDFDDPALPGLFPAPDRYLKRAPDSTS